MENAMSYQKAVEYINKIPKFTTKTDLDNTRYMLKLLGNPEREKKIIHVAGTNGKGSVCAYLASILGQAEFCSPVGLFTSPHLINIEERIQLNGKSVNKEQFAEAFQKLYQISQQMLQEGYRHPAYFEFLFGMAMYIFGRVQTEWIILETGLGGRLDATNIIECPVITIITSIDYDHMEILGDTIEKIAMEKAGIIKAGVPVVYWAENSIAAKVIENTARQKQCISYPVTKKNYQILKIKDKSIDFCAVCGYYENSIFSLPFQAPYQVENAILALTAVGALNLQREIGENTIHLGIQNVRWQGRMEEILPDVIVDGAHNRAGIKAFMEAVRNQGITEPVYLLFSAVKEKDYKRMVQEITASYHWSGIILTEIDGGRKLAAKVLEKLFKEQTKAPIYICENEKEAFTLGLRLKGKNGRLYCVGSLYLVGNIKESIRRNHDD